MLASRDYVCFRRKLHASSASMSSRNATRSRKAITFQIGKATSSQQPCRFQNRFQLTTVRPLLSAAWLVKSFALLIPSRFFYRNPYLFSDVTYKDDYSFKLLRWTVYVSSTNAWYDSKSQTEVLNLLLFSQLERALSTSGLAGLDTLFAFMIAAELTVRILTLWPIGDPLLIVMEFTFRFSPLFLVGMTGAFQRLAARCLPGPGFSGNVSRIRSRDNSNQQFFHSAG